MKWRGACSRNTWIKRAILKKAAFYVLFRTSKLFQALLVMFYDFFTGHTGPDWNNFVHKFSFDQKHAQMYQKSDLNDFESSFLILQFDPDFSSFM